MSGENSKNDNTTVLGLASAIVSKINNLISSHNSNTSAHSDKESTSNKVTSWSSTVSDTKYASEKLIKDSLDAKQNALVSGTSIKTINNNSILGSGNLTIESGSGGSNITNYYYDASNNEIILEYDSGVTQADIVTSWSNTLSDDNVPSEKLVKNSLDAIGGGTVDSALSSISENPVQNKVIYNALSSKISTSNTSGLVKNDGSIDTNTYLTSHQDISNYIQKSNTNGLIKNDGSVDTSSYITSSSLPSASSSTPSADTTNGSYGSGTSYARANHTHPKSSIYAESSHTHTTTDITNLSVPTASSSTPTADTTNGTYGSGTSYARSDHAHPKSSLYAESNHTHTYSNISNVTTVDVTVTYTDNSTETIKLLKYTGS